MNPNLVQIITLQLFLVWNYCSDKNVYKFRLDKNFVHYNSKKLLFLRTWPDFSETSI